MRSSCWGARCYEVGGWTREDYLFHFFALSCNSCSVIVKIIFGSQDIMEFFVFEILEYE